MPFDGERARFRRPPVSPAHDHKLARTERDFRATAEAVYRDSVAAMAAWNRLVDSEGGSLESAAERVTKSPELLGPLLTEPQSSVWGPAAAKLGFASARVAREAVPQMLRRAVLYARALREATKPVEWTDPDGDTVHGRAKVRSRARTVVLDRINTVYMAGLKRCYRLGLAEDANLNGRVAITFTVDERGKVIDEDATGVSSLVDGCISKLMINWRFPIPKDKDGSPTDASFAVSLALQPS